MMNRGTFRVRGGGASRGIRYQSEKQPSINSSNRFAVLNENRPRGGSNPRRPFSTRNDERKRLKKWLLCNVIEAPGNEELDNFILGVIYKLQDFDYNLEKQNKIQIEDANWNAVIQNLDRKMKERAYIEAKIVFAVIFGRIQDDEKKILRNKLCGVRCIFIDSSDDEAIDTVAERIIDISQDKSDENSLPEVHHPMRLAKIRLLDDDALTDHELLFKLNNPSFFLSLNETRDHQNQFQNFSDEELLFLKLVAKSCKVNATHYRESLINLFDQFFASKFLRETVTQDINAISLLVLAENKQNVQQKAHFYRRFLTFCLEIFVELLRTLPRKMLDNASTFVPMYNLLSNASDSTFVESCGLWDENLDKWKAAFITLFTDAKTKISNYTDEEVKARTASSGVRKEKPPPNNFRELGVFPSPEEILFETKPYLRKNLVDQAYNSVEHYLDVQFRLLREDYIAPLREGIAAYLKCGQHKRKLDITVYDCVTVFPPTMDKKSGQMVSTVSFTSKGMKKVRWEVSRKLLYGSLVCISGDKFRESLFFATVYDRKPEQLAEGKIGVVFELQPGQPVFNYRKEGYVMVESSAYFEAYRHVLQALLAIKDENDMPFPTYFVSCNNKISPPKFLLRNGGQLNLDCLVQNDLHRKNRSIDILNSSAWMGHTAFGLDESQYEAIKLALTRELAIIQGPPGTGKTFIGYSITKVLLENQSVWRTSDTPILVVCYTNHALDQFLEGITTFMKEGLIRIGGRSKNPNMEQYLLKNTNELHVSDISSDIYFQLNKLRTEKEGFENALVNLSNVTSLLRKSIMNYDNLESVANRQLLQQIVRNNEKQPFSKNDLIRIWLTALKPFQLRRLPVDIDALYYLMCETQFPQVACANALLAARGDFYDAIGVLRIHRNNPDLYRAGPQLIGLPPLEHLQQLMNRNYSFEDALFALQCNDCNFQRALQWLTAGFPSEILPDQEKTNEKPQDAIPFELMEQMRLDNAENQNRMLDDDDDDDVNDDDDFMRKTANLNLQNNFELTKVDALNKDWSGAHTKIPLSETFLKMIIKSPPMPIEEARSIADAWALPIKDRWRLYTSWVETFRERCETRMSNIQQKYAATVGRYNEIKTMKTMAIVKRARVLGMTTTGAAKHQSVLSAVKPKIAIIEEAAEVLESHIITSLSSSCEHLILIGDHFQLRPNPSVYQLAKHFNFDVSLFERLINNGFPHAVLTEQHRMRSEIADNLMPYFYSNLRNHKSVDEYENVKGMSKNMYFFNHGHLEDQDGDSTTRKNVFEAKMIVGLFRYLQQQGYKPDQITILCCYAGQMFFIRKMISDKYKAFGTDKMVRISVVDDYQGEESDIILLSFVRSNQDGKIGFLKTKNRVCVALSRAKIGLFCFGNFDHLAACSNELWGDIVQNLKDKGYLGNALSLTCQIHSTETSIYKMEDFERLVPEGGCNKICEFRLNCGHSCTINCHTQNIDHAETKCTKDCPKKCPSGHPCNRPCHEPCPPCAVIIEKRPLYCCHVVAAKCHVPDDRVLCDKPCETVLSCGHECDMKCHPVLHSTRCQVLVDKVLPCTHTVQIPCYRFSDEKVDCNFKIAKVLPKCGHTRMVACYKDPVLVTCREPCSTELKCGHLCKGNCNDCRNGRLHVACNEDCGKILICGHKCETPCAADCPPCEKNCKMQCSHSKCSVDVKNKKSKAKVGSNRICGAPCPPCNEKCSWKCPHFQCKQKCGDGCDRPRCNEKCKKTVKCSTRACKEVVQCLSLCGEACIHICPKCNESRLKEIREIFFGMEEEPDARFIKLRDCDHIFEVSGFDSYVDNSLIEADDDPESEPRNNNGKAIKFVECPYCKTPIFKTERYRDVLKPKINEIQQIKAKICGNMMERKDRLKRLQQKLKIVRTELNAKIEPSYQRRSDFRDNQILDMIKIIHDYMVKLSDVVDRANAEESYVSKLVRWENFANYAEHLFIFLRKKTRESVDGTLPVSAPEITKFMMIFGRTPDITSASQFEVASNAILHLDLTKLIKIMNNCQKRASAQLFNELAGEVRRFGLLVKVFSLIGQLMSLGKHQTPNSSDQRRKVLIDNMSILDGKEIITDQMVDSYVTDLKELARVASTGLGVSNDERLQIIQAMNMRQGHWYKCPNGHFYCIADCGGAVVTATCAECKAPIGGQSHQLLSSNSDATAEMLPEYANVPLQSLIQQGDEEMARRLQEEFNRL